MTDNAERLATLRAEFDGSFGEPVHPPDAQHAELLALRAGGRPYALRLAQTSGLHPDRPVTPLPGPLRALLGVAGSGLLGAAGVIGLRRHVQSSGLPPSEVAMHHWRRVKEAASVGANSWRGQSLMSASASASAPAAVPTPRRRTAEPVG